MDVFGGLRPSHLYQHHHCYYFILVAIWRYDGRVERNQPKGWKQAGDDPRGPCGPSTWEYHSALKTMGLLVSATVGGAWRTGGSVKENSQERIPWNEVSGGQVQRDRAPGAGGGATGSLSSVGTEV